MKPDQKYAARYGRISDDQADDGHGVNNQDDATAGHCDRRGYLVASEHVYSDNDISATHGAFRPAYTAMMAAAARREFSVIVVFQTSRLWRNRKERAEGIEILKNAGVSVEAVKGPSLDMTTAYGRGMAGMLGEFDTMETEVKSERQQLAAQGRARNGAVPLGVRLLGYTLAGEIIESEAVTVREIFARFHAGDSIRGIARWLQESGVPTRKGGKWAASSVTGILRNPRYAGRVYYNRRDNGTSGDWYPAGYKAVVDEAVFDAAQARFDDPRRKAMHHGYEHKYLGSGLYLCGYCGKHVRSSGSIKMYVCPDGCVNRTASNIDVAVTALVRARLGKPDVATLVNKPTGKAATAAAAELRKQRSRLAKVEQDYDNELIDGHRYKEKSAKVKAEIAAAQARLVRVTAGSEVAGVLASPEPVREYENAPVGIKQSVIRFFMDVELLSAPRGRIGFDPETIRIIPKHPAKRQLHAVSASGATDS